MATSIMDGDATGSHKRGCCTLVDASITCGQPPAGVKARALPHAAAGARRTRRSASPCLAVPRRSDPRPPRGRL